MKHILAAIISATLAAAAFGHGYMHNKPFRMAEHRANPACPAEKQASPQNAPCEFKGDMQAPCAFQNMRNMDKRDGYGRRGRAEAPRGANADRGKGPACFDVRACAPADNPRACGFQGKHRMYSRCDFAGDRRCDGPRVYKHGYRGGHFRGGPERFAHRRGGECPAFNGRHWRAPQERPCGFYGNTGRPPFRGHYRGESPCFAERHFRGPECFGGRPTCSRFDDSRACGFQGKRRMDDGCDFRGDRRIDSPCNFRDGRNMNRQCDFGNRPRMDAPRNGGHFRGKHARFDDRRECPANMERRAPANDCNCVAPERFRADNSRAVCDTPRRDMDGGRPMRHNRAGRFDGRRGGDAPERVTENAPAPEVCPQCGERHMPVPE